MIDVVFSFDTTGSMYPCLREVRRRLHESVGRLFGELDDLQIGIIAHGDYCDYKMPYITKELPFGDNMRLVQDFVDGVERTNGGDAAECYELVLHDANDFDWRDEATKVFVMIGDDVPHPKGYTYRWSGRRAAETLTFQAYHDWNDQARRLANSGVVIYAVQCLNRSGRGWFWSELGNMGQGAHITLAQFDDITETILALTYKQVSDERVEQFREEVKSSMRLNRGLARLFNVLLDEDEPDATPLDLAAVPEGRFQVFRLERDTPIKQFVEDMGISFGIGRGFYELVKPVLVQERKEVVLVHNETGDMYSGEKAREMIGLPYGMRGNVSPNDYTLYGDRAFVPFIQSTSWNRKLLRGQRFLYEVT